MKAKFLSEIFSNAPLTVAGLLIFFGVFVSLVFWVYARKGAKAEYENMAQLPLSEDEVAV